MINDIADIIAAVITKHAPRAVEAVGSLVGLSQVSARYGIGGQRPHIPLADAAPGRHSHRLAGRGQLR